MSCNKKKYFVILTIIPILLLSLVACSDTSSTKDMDWWTENQVNAIHTLKNEDGKACLYSMTYTDNLYLDEIIEAGAFPVNSKLFPHIKKYILGGTVYSYPDTSFGQVAISSDVSANASSKLIVSNLDEANQNPLLVTIYEPETGFKSINISDTLSYGISSDMTLDSNAKEWMLYSPYFAFEGLNEKGLAIVAVYSDDKPHGQNSGKAIIPSNLVVRLLLDKASNIDEAEKLLKQYDVAIDESVIDSNISWYILDTSNQAVHFEYIDDELSVSKIESQTISDITKFNTVFDLNTKKLTLRPDIKSNKSFTFSL